jgi:hypothetical protein
MALAVAFAAHVHGEYLKQKNTRFGPASVHIGRSILYLSFVTLGLIIAVIVAGYARYSIAIHSIAAVPDYIIPIPGEDASSANNPLVEVYFSLGINLIVWLIGLTVSFMSHDENNEIMSAGLEKWWCNRKFENAHKPWIKSIAKIYAQSGVEIDQLRKATELFKAYAEDHRNELDQVNKREEQLYNTLANYSQGIIDLYRIILGNRLHEKNHGIRIGEKVYSGKDYQQRLITINGDNLRKLVSHS